ncbi:hypothetical protein [Streptomyces sp. NPDC126499]|uniref:hypothetical protein n=1 Tax=Streptomyces sp. NPDC126499 TaxID=3155314 RepID=UPI0033285C82
MPTGTGTRAAAPTAPAAGPDARPVAPPPAGPDARRTAPPHAERTPAQGSRPGTPVPDTPVPDTPVPGTPVPGIRVTRVAVARPVEAPSEPDGDGPRVAAVVVGGASGPVGRPFVRAVPLPRGAETRAEPVVTPPPVAVTPVRLPLPEPTHRPEEPQP